MMYAAAVACAKANVPWAALSTSLNPVTPRDWRCDLTDTLARIDAKRHAFVGAGARFRVSDVVSPWLNVAFTCREYIGGVDVSEGVHLVGARFDDADRDVRDAGAVELDRRPRVYASFG